MGIERGLKIVDMLQKKASSPSNRRNALDYSKAMNL